MKHLRKSIYLLVLTISLSLLAPSFNLPNVPGTAEAATVKLNKKRAVLIKGKTLKLKVTGTKSKIKWTSSKPNIASVNANGKVTAKKKGNTTITAKFDKKSLKCKITVETPSISQKTLSLEKGKTYTLKMKGNTQKVKWSSSSNSIASVSQKGKVTAKKAGTCKITAAIGTVKYTCNITVTAPSDNTTNQTDNQTETDSDNETDDDNQTQYVYIPATGKKYHKISNCGTMNPSTAKKVTKSKAIADGYTACKKCYQ